MSSHKQGCPNYQDDFSFLCITSKQRNQNWMEKKIEVSARNTAFQGSHVSCLHCILSEALKEYSPDLSRSHLCSAVSEHFYKFV